MCLLVCLVVCLLLCFVACLFVRVCCLLLLPEFVCLCVCFCAVRYFVFVLRLFWVRRFIFLIGWFFRCCLLAHLWLFVIVVSVLFLLDDFICLLVFVVCLLACLRVCFAVRAFAFARLVACLFACLLVLFNVKTQVGECSTDGKHSQNK